VVDVTVATAGSPCRPSQWNPDDRGAGEGEGVRDFQRGGDVDSDRRDPRDASDVGPGQVRGLTRPDRDDVGA